VLIPSRIKLSAERLSVPVAQPESINAIDGIEQVREFRPDVLVTAAYGQILSPSVLEIPRFGGINLHGSLLPAFRGAAPVARAIQAGFTRTGVTVIQMSPRIDAGGMISTAELEIGPDETAGELEERLAQLGAPLVVDAIDRLGDGPIPHLKQNRALVTKAPKLTKDDGLIDWNQPAQAIHNLVRAMSPWPKAFTEFVPGGSEPAQSLRLIVHRTAVELASGPAGIVVEAGGHRLVVAAGEAAVRLIEVQVPGKRVIDAAEFVRGYRVKVGDRLGPRAGE
jgi:methionyl-tRNA formyltransferase